jgi:hypothetical protein
MKHTLDSVSWENNAGVLYPASGGMAVRHIKNTIAFLQKPSTVARLQTEERTTGEGYMALIRGIRLSCMEPQKYIEKRIKTSILWGALHEGLKLYEDREE